MVKRVKLISLTVIFCLCLSLLLIAVYATTTIMFSVTSSLNYTPSPKDYINWEEDTSTIGDPNDGYWTITMGEYVDPETQEVTPLVWKMVLKEETNNEVSSVSNYTQDTELSGSYYFLLDTFIEDVLTCSYENEFHRNENDDFIRLDQYGTRVYVNDYAVSNIREYLTGVDVYRGYDRTTGSSNGHLTFTYTPSINNVVEQTEPENFITKFNIAGSPIYNMIEGRTLSDLYAKMGYTANSSGHSIPYDSDVSISQDTEDKFWLLSLNEAFTMKCRHENWLSNSYWLRTPKDDGDSQCYLLSHSNTGSPSSASGQYPHQATNYVRPAFKLTF